MAYKNTYQEITRSLYARRDGDSRSNALYNRFPKTEGNNGYISDLVSDFTKIGVHFLQQTMAEQKAKEQSIKTADMNFYGSANVQSAISGLGKDRYESFLKTHSENIRKGTELVNKYKSDSQEYLEGKEMIQAAQQAAQNAANNKTRYAEMVKRVQGIDLDNMDNTVSFEASTYTAQINNGSFFQKNDVYIDDNGNFMTNAMKGSQRVISQEAYNSLPQFKKNNYVVGSEELGDKINGNKIGGDELTVLTQSDVIEGKGTEHAQTLVNPLNAAQGYKLVERQATNIFDLPLGYKNQQLDENSLQNQIEGFLDVQQMKGYQHLTNNQGQGIDIANTDGGEQELRKDVGTMLQGQSTNQLRSFIHNGLLEIPVSTTINGETTTKIHNVHPAEVLLWQRGVDNPEMSAEELAEARIAWGNNESFTQVQEFDPSKEGDDKKVVFNNEKGYLNALKVYNTTASMFATNHNVTLEDKDTITDMIVDNAMAANKAGVEKYTAAEKQKEIDSWKMLPSEKRKIVKQKQQKKDFQSLWYWDPALNGGKGGRNASRAQPEDQIKWFRDNIDQGRDFADDNMIKFFEAGEKHPQTNEELDVSGYYYNTSPTGGVILETVPEVKDSNGKVIENAYDVDSGQWSLWNEGFELDIHNEF